MLIKTISLVEVQNLAKDIVEKSIDAKELANIKENDPNPLFQVFKIAETGKSNTNVIGRGAMVLRWFRNAIEKIHEKIKIGTKVFWKHAQNTNEHKNRTEIGRVVGKIIEKVHDIADSFAIIYREPQYREIKADIASYEGALSIPDIDRRGGIVTPQDVGDVTGIVLADSRIDTPAFAGATFQMAVQNLVDGANKIMELEEIKELIKEKRWRIDDFFSDEEILAHPKVENYAREKNANSYGQAQRLARELEEKSGELKLAKEDLAEKDKEIKKRDEQILEKQKAFVKIKVKDIQEEVLSERKLSPKRLKYITRELKRFEPSGEESAAKRELNKEVDNILSSYDEYVKDGIFEDDKYVEPGSEDPKDNGKDEDKKKAKAPFTTKDGLEPFLKDVPVDQVAAAKDSLKKIGLA